MNGRFQVFLILLAAVATLGPAPAAAQSAGGGVSVFIPEALYKYDEGSISIETSFQTAVGLGGGLSVPIGIAYNQVYGLSPSRATDEYRVSRPWFYADSLLPYIMAQARFGIGELYLDLFGGAAGNWNIAIRPLTANIEADISEEIEGDRISFRDAPEITTSFGIGYTAGASVGLILDFGSVEVRGAFRNVWHTTTLTGIADNVVGGGTFDAGEKIEPFRLLLRGFSVGAVLSVNL